MERSKEIRMIKKWAKNSWGDKADGCSRSARVRIEFPANPGGEMEVI